MGSKFILISAVLGCGLISSSAYAGLTCKDLFVAKSANGIFEARLKFDETRLEEMKISFQQILNSLDKGGSDWKPLDPKLVESIDTALKQYNHQDYDAMTPERLDAIAKIKTALQNSVEFKNIGGQNIESLTSTLVRGVPDLQSSVLGAKPVLYYAITFLSINKSEDLKRLVVSMLTVGEQISKFSAERGRVENMLSRGLSGISDFAELMSRYRVAKADLDKAMEVPKDLVDSLVAIARENNVVKFKDLVKSHPFFRSAERGPLESLDRKWNQIKTDADARKQLLEFRNTPEVRVKNREARLLEEAINVFPNLLRLFLEKKFL